MGETKPPPQTGPGSPLAAFIVERNRENLARRDVLQRGPEPSEPSVRRAEVVDGRRVALPIDETDREAEVAALRARSAESETRRAEARAEELAFRRATESERLERWPDATDRARLAARSRRGAI